MYAIELGHFSFSAWNGWLNTWQKCNNVRLATLSGEAADVDPAVVDNWRKGSVVDLHRIPPKGNLECSQDWPVLQSCTNPLHGDERRSV